MRLSESPSVISNRFSVFWIFFLMLTVTVPALAHHSFTMYDTTKTMTLHGTVKSFEWSNPHIVLWMYAERAGAPPELWGLELSSPGNMRSQGWTRRSLQSGDKIVVELAPRRNGDHGGWLNKVTTASGVVLKSTSLRNLR